MLFFISVIIMGVAISLKSYYHIRAYKIEREINQINPGESEIFAKIFYSFPVKYVSFYKKEISSELEKLIKRGNLFLLIFIIAFIVGAISGYVYFR